MWRPGDQIVVRYRTSGRLSGVIPVTIAASGPDFIAYYLAAGTPYKYPVDIDDGVGLLGRERGGIGDRAWRMIDGVWHTNVRLYVVPHGAAYAISLFWQASDWAFLGWYVDLQAPLVCIPCGFETEDYLLDILVAPDRSWRWKDEDELEIAVHAGRFSTAQAAQIRAKAQRVVRMIEMWTWPFNADWEHWRPDPSWPVPKLPDGWDVVGMGE